ncbi:hypothetical protein [Bradyrhizobium stylosanthis]|uniref:hypothetical protein n=1 Tax=Bradyrhizobium stylosanthis TaxID=1803665 RepID=UPI0009ED63FE|nr:hypothetical protein [Bradyrhizobium stylosanthis]
MITAEKCRELAAEYKKISQLSGQSSDRVFLMRNIARTLTGLAGQLARLSIASRGEQASDGTRCIDQASQLPGRDGA